MECRSFDVDRWEIMGPKYAKLPRRAFERSEEDRVVGMDIADPAAKQTN
jgi:hypothetical protein